jgi:3-hydroxyisobutyrate dehydrogenase
MGAVCRLATLEVVAMGRSFGLPMATLTEAINQSTGRSRISQVVLPAILNGTPSTDLTLRTVIEGMDEVLASGMRARVPMPLAGLARGLLQVGVNTRGPDARLDDVIGLVESMAAVRLADERASMLPHAAAASARADGLVVGYVGLGVMGAALARRLLQSRAVHVFDARPDVVRPLAAAGATAHKDLPSLARDCDVVMLCLPTSEVVREVLFGAGGLLKELAPGAIVVDQTSGDPMATRDMADTLRVRGIALVDAPVSGGPGGAAAGTIATFCGGPRQAFATVRALLGTAGPGVTYFGASGNGHAAKLIKNALGACNRLIAYEALALGVKLGLRIADIARVVNRGAAWSATFERIAAVLATGGTTATLRIELMVKDLDLASKMSMGCGAPMLIASAVRNIVQACANELGGDANIDQMATLYERKAGVRFTGA